VSSCVIPVCLLRPLSQRDAAATCICGCPGLSDSLQTKITISKKTCLQALKRLCKTFPRNMLNLQRPRFLPTLTCFAAILALSMLVGTGAEVIELNTDNVDQYFPHPDKSVFVYFYASWCGYCISFAPEFAAAAEAFMAQSDKVIFVKGDADIHKSFGGRFGVSGFPTIQLYVAGEEGARAPKAFSGERTKDGVINFINSILGTSVTGSGPTKPKEKTLISAVFDHDIPGLLQLIEAGADVHATREGVPAIFWAAELGHKDTLKILVDNGADYSWDPACLIGDLDRIEELIGKGQDVDAKEKTYGTTCLMLAAEKNYPDLISYLVKRGAKLDIENVSGNTALIKAAEFGMMDALRALVEAGAPLSQANKAGKTAHQIAVEEGKTEAAAYLTRNANVHHVEPVAGEQVLDSDKHDLPGHSEDVAKSDL
jgi:protein disulfide-isomerase-like protein